MEHKSVRIAVRIIGILALLEAIVAIDVGIFGLRVFELWSANGVRAIYTLSILGGLIESVASFGLMWVRKWGMIIFYIFTAASWCTSIASVMIGFVSIMSALPSLIIVTAAAFYLLYVQKKIFSKDAVDVVK